MAYRHTSVHLNEDQAATLDWLCLLLGDKLPAPQSTVVQRALDEMYERKRPEIEALQAEVGEDFLERREKAREEYKSLLRRPQGAHRG